jgi:hypothetical protein
MGLGGGGAMGAVMGAFGQRRTRRAGRSELWKAAGKASSAVPAAIHSAVPAAIHTGGGAGGGGGYVATRRVALLQALQGNSLYLRARGCLMRWRAATRSRRVLAKWLTEASLHALALGAAAALYWWRRLTRRHRGARRRRHRADRYFERRLEQRVWRGWLRLVQLGRRRRDDEARKSWEAAHAGFVKWASVLETARAAVKRRRAAMAHVRRGRLARGMAAFRSRAASRVASQLARAQATARRRLEPNMDLPLACKCSPRRPPLFPHRRRLDGGWPLDGYARRASRVGRSRARRSCAVVGKPLPRSSTSDGL